MRGVGTPSFHGRGRHKLYFRGRAAAERAACTQHWPFVPYYEGNDIGIGHRSLVVEQQLPLTEMLSKSV